MDAHEPLITQTNYHTIIHKSYFDLSGTVQRWSHKCEALAVAQHEADDEIPRIHCHLLMIGCLHQKDWFQKDLRKDFPGINGREDFRFYTETQKEKKLITPEGLWYLLKGDPTALKFLKNFSNEQVEVALKHYDPGKAKRQTIEQPKDKVNQFTIVKEIRDKLKISRIDLISYQLADIPTNQSTFSQNYNEIMDTILLVLDAHEIKTGLYDIERWFITVVRSDESWKTKIKDKIFSKLSI